MALITSDCDAVRAVTLEEFEAYLLARSAEFAERIDRIVRRFIR